MFLITWALWTFLIALAGLGAGILSAERKWAPQTLYKEWKQVVHSLRATGKVLPKRTYFRRSRRSADVRHTLHDAGAAAQGYIAVTRFDLETPGYQVDLMGPDGTLLHSWPIRHDRLFEGGNPLEFPHGTKVLPDGSLVANFDAGIGMARIDACGDAIWTRDDGKYHHEIAAGLDGLWTWFAKDGASLHGNALLRFDPETGAHLESIHLVDDVVLASEATAAAYTIPPGFRFKREATGTQAPDTFHPNDIDPLPAEMAAAFPMFSAGDLLISLRNTNMLAVVDRDSFETLWSAHGPWLQQHDPDWQPDGTITVFSNNPDRFRSAIVQIDPATGATVDLFSGNGPEFDSYIMGTHQRLPNGNWLITSSMEGRVLEVTAGGAPVREISNVLNDSLNGIVPNAEFLTQQDLPNLPSCPTN